MPRHLSGSFWIVVLVALVSFAGVQPVTAADQVGSAPSPARPSPKPDFLFGRPTTSVAVRATWLMPREGGDVFAFVRHQLTVNRGAFSTGALSADAGLLITPRVSLLAGLEVNRRDVQSEDRNYLGNDGLPINQRSQLSSQLFEGTLTVALVDPGHRISRYAWIPRTVTPFVGAGGGAAHYRFVQEGEFVDYTSLRVFTDEFITDGWAPSAHALAGVDVHVWRNAYITAQAKYVRALAHPRRDFDGFDTFDLSGFRTESGFRFVF